MMRFKHKTSMSLILKFLIISNSLHSIICLPVILPTTAVLLPNIGQYLTLIQILVLKLVIWTQIMRLLGQDYVGKGIKSTIQISEEEEENLDEILDQGDMIADQELNTLDRAESQIMETIESKSLPVEQPLRPLSLPPLKVPIKLNRFGSKPVLYPLKRMPSTHSIKEYQLSEENTSPMPVYTASSTGAHNIISSQSTTIKPFLQKEDLGSQTKNMYFNKPEVFEPTMNKF